MRDTRVQAKAAKSGLKPVTRNTKPVTKQDQAKKSIWWMPWHQEPKKDVISCEKLRRAANRPRPADVRMGKPTRSKELVSYDEYIVMRRETGGTETSKYPEEKKETSIS